MGKKLTTTEFISRSRQVHGDAYDYSASEYVSAMAKISIICPIHGQFSQLAMDHMKGRGCSLCNERQQMTTSNFVTRATEIHGGKYDYSSVRYVNTYTKVTIRCSMHGIFHQSPKDHLAGYGCPLCGGTEKVTKEDFIHRAQEVHGDAYDYSRIVLHNMNTNVLIICAEHGEFLQRPADHINGTGCPVCGKLKQTSRTPDYLVTHPETAITPTWLYLIVVDDTFCKIGITTKHYIKQRFPGMKFNIMASESMTLQEALLKEHTILDKYNHMRYKVHELKSRAHASGWTECFPMSLLPELQKEFNK